LHVKKEVKMKKILLALGVLLLAMTACAVPALPVSPVPTSVLSPTAFPNESPTPFPSPTASPTPLIILPTQTVATPTPFPTFTSVPPLSPEFTVNIDSNCRSGPSTAYSRLGYILNGETVPILGVTTPERPVWWYVQTKNGTRCWVSGNLGVTSGNLSGIPQMVAPPLPPTPTPETNLVEVLFENNTGANICELVFYDGVQIVKSFTWNKGDWKGDGSDVYLTLPVGGYDLIEAYNCKGNLEASLKNIVLNKDNDAYPIPYP
jgi:SH3-like domain-containing protein